MDQELIRYLSSVKLIDEYFTNILYYNSKKLFIIKENYKKNKSRKTLKAADKNINDSRTSIQRSRTENFLDDSIPISEDDIGLQFGSIKHFVANQGNGGYEDFNNFNESVLSHDKFNTKNLLNEDKDKEKKKENDNEKERERERERERETEEEIKITKKPSNIFTNY